MKHLLSLFVMIFCSHAMAAFTLQPAGFVKALPMPTNPSEIYFSSELFDEPGVSGVDPFLTGRPVPNFVSMNNYDPLSGEENLTTYRSESLFLVETAKANAFFTTVPVYSADPNQFSLVNLMDQGFVHTLSDPAQANAAFTADMQSGVNSAVNVLNLKKERWDLDVTEEDYNAAIGDLQGLQQAMSQPWCQAPRTCVTSTVVFGAGFDGILALVSPVAMAAGKQIPNQIYMLSDAAVFTAGQPEFPAEANQLATPAVRAFELRTFYANFLMQFAKIVVAQHDLGNGTSLISVQSTIALERNDLDRSLLGFSPRDFVMGNSVAYNTDQGFSAGLPSMHKNLSQNLKARIDQL